MQTAGTMIPAVSIMEKVFSHAGAGRSVQSLPTLLSVRLPYILTGAFMTRNTSTMMAGTTDRVLS